MSSAQLIEGRRVANAFCAAHLPECCAELIDWQSTSILKNGRVRELAKLCAKYVGESDSLRVAEREIERQACIKVAADCGEPTKPEGAKP